MEVVKEEPEEKEPVQVKVEQPPPAEEKPQQENGQPSLAAVAEPQQQPPASDGESSAGTKRKAAPDEADGPGGEAEEPQKKKKKKRATASPPLLPAGEEAIDQKRVVYSHSKRYMSDFPLEQLLGWFSQEKADNKLPTLRSICGSVFLPDVASCYARTKDAHQRGLGAPLHELAFSFIASS